MRKGSVTLVQVRVFGLNQYDLQAHHLAKMAKISENHMTRYDTVWVGAMCPLTRYDTV